MKGTWGKRVFGTVRRDKKFTRFRIEVQLENGCTVYCSQLLLNDDLEDQPEVYGWILDKMVEVLQARIDERAQSWARQ